jgi:G3E family GTPase
MTAFTRLAPVTVVTGFLGSGKTTLLNHMLKHPSLRRAAVLINEFGEVPIDHYLVDRIADDIVVLPGGCVCCTIRDDLKSSIVELCRRRSQGEIPAFARLVIETTGLAEPAPIVFTIMADEMLRHHFRPGTIIATVDAVNAAGQLALHESAVKQIAVADRLVLTKTDLAAPATLAALKARLQRLNPTAEIRTARHGRLDVRRLLSADAYNTATRGGEANRWLRLLADQGEQGAGHDDKTTDRHGGIHAFSVAFDRPMDWTAFGLWLTLLIHRHGQHVLRVKGVLNVRGVDVPVLINAVQHVVHPPMHLPAWPDADRRSRIVFIVRGLERRLVEASLALVNRVGSAAG